MTKVSEVSVNKLASYLRISETDSQIDNELQEYLDIAKKYIKDETGLDDLDEHEDFVIAVYVLCQDMYDNRCFYVDKSNVNQVVKNILGRHRINLL